MLDAVIMTNPSHSLQLTESLLSSQIAFSRSSLKCPCISGHASNFKSFNSAGCAIFVLNPGSGPAHVIQHNAA